MYSNNSVYVARDIPLERSKLDRRRLEAAHFKYAVLSVASWYPGDIDTAVSFSPDLHSTLLEFTPRFQQAFHKKYSGTYIYMYVKKQWK